MQFYLSIAVTVEIIFIILGIFSAIRRHVESSAEAYAYAAVLSLSIFSVG